MIQDELKEERRYWNSRKVALDRTLCRICYRRGYGPVVKQTTQ